MSRKIVVTGIGTVNALGNNISDFWKNIRDGVSGVDKITKFDTTDYAAKIAAHVKDFDSSNFVENREAKRIDNFTLYAMSAALEAMTDAGLSDSAYDPERIGVIIGNGIGGMDTLEDSYWKLFERGPRRVPIMTIPKLIANMGPARIAIQFNAQGPCYTVTTACSSGSDAIGDAARWIKDGTCDVMITGGTEACISKLGVSGFCVIQALSTKYNDTPTKASRPFDKDRDGFVIGEGAGILILEEYEHAVNRGAKIYCEYGGNGISCDANHITAPHPEARGAVQAMNMALRVAELEPQDIDYVNAHGTSTPLNDPTETLAIKKVFGEHAHKLKVSSTKSMTGHCIGGAGGIEAIVGVLSIRDQFIPPTINLDETDPECDLDYVPNKGIDATVNNVMSNSLGFGGHNGIVILKRM